MDDTILTHTSVHLYPIVNSDKQWMTLYMESAMFVNCIFLVTLYCFFAKRRSLVSKLNSPVKRIVIRDSDVSKAHPNFLFCYLMLFRVYHQKGSAYVPYLYHNNHTCIFDIRANTYVRTLFIHSFNIKMVIH